MKTILASLAPIAELTGAGEYFKMPQNTGGDDFLVNVVEFRYEAEVLLPE